MDPVAASSDDETAQTVNPNSESPRLIGQCTNTNIDQSQQHQQLPQEQQPPPHSAELAPTSDGVHRSEKRKRSDGDSEESENGGSKSSQSQHFLWKTSLCSYFRREASCSHGDACRFAHGEEELRQRPDNTWDPTSERAKKMLKRTAESAEGDGVMMMTEVVAGDSSDPALRKCLVHLPMKWSSDNLKNFLDEQGISVKSSKKRKGMSVGFLSFENMEQVKNAIEGLDGKSVGNKNLKVADVMPRSFEKKTTLVSGNARVSISSNGAEDGDTVVDCSVPDGPVPKGRSVRDVVTSLANLPYADQLEQKKNSLAHTLKRLTRNARKACPNGASLPEWILKSREIGGLPCELVGILESPLVNGYRNKCEFSVGFSLEEKPTVGFMLGNFREGVTAVQEPLDCPNVSKISCKYTSIFQEFLQHSSLPIWNRFNNVGFWRQLTVREGRAPRKPTEVEDVESHILEVMLIVQVCTVGFEDEQINSELEKMAEAFATGASANSPSLPLTALVIQDHRGISNAAPPDAPLLLLSIPKSGVEVAGGVSEARIHDYISNLRFSISPTAFFQVNTLAAEKLYSLAGDWANLTPDTLLFDICCGTGTIGLTLAHRVGMVVGIEMNASAVSDAHRNAEINGIKNCKFICAKAEDVMGSLLKEYVDLPNREDGLLSTSRSTSDKSATVEEKVVSIYNVTDPEESSCLGLENTNDTTTCLQILNDQQKVENQQENNSISEDESHSMRQFKNVVAIVDPPRVGLHPTVIKVLRIHPSLRRLVYISCNPDSLVANAIELCTPSADKSERGNKNNKGWRNMSSAGLARHRAKSMPDSEPFQPVKAVAVDLFPHTPHCETVMLLER